jgi:hypothetical protein
MSISNASLQNLALPAAAEAAAALALSPAALAAAAALAAPFAACAKKELSLQFKQGIVILCTANDLPSLQVCRKLLRALLSRQAQL